MTLSLCQPPPRAKLGSRLTFAGAVVAGLLFLLWLRLYQPPNTVDDAYTTFRYARNLINGLGFVYNPGERVLGTTTPAYALLLALAALVSGYRDFPRLALMVNALLNCLSFALALRLTARLSGRRWAGLAAGLLLALEGRLLDFSTGGMESSFYLTTILATWVGVIENRTVPAALATGLACLIRPDGAILAAIVFGLWGVEALLRAGVIRSRFPLFSADALRAGRWLRELPWRELGLLALVIMPWIVFAVLYYGQPIPQSVLAKAELYRIPPLTAFRAFLVQLRTVFPFSIPPLQDNPTVNDQLAQVLLPGSLVLLGLYVAGRRRPRAWAIGAYIALFIAFYSLGNPFWIGWYEIPMMPFYHALILTAAVHLGNRLTHFAPPTGRSVLRHLAYWPGVIAFVIMAVPFLSRLNLLPWEKPLRPPFVLNAAFNKRREFDYLLFARMLAPAARADRLVAIPEIGAFGYAYGYTDSAGQYHPGRLFDTSGLISPKTLDYFPIPPEIPFEIYSVPRPLIFDLKFDLFVTFDHFIQATIPPDDPEFLALYRPTLGLTSHAAFGIQRLIAYRRNDLPIEVDLPPEAIRAAARFGPDYLRLAGYEVLSTQDSENRFVDALLFWQGRDTPIDRDLLVRVRLWDAQGNLVYEILDQPGERLFPTQSWTPGMWLVDRYPLKRPASESLPYSISITVFASDADDPLPAIAADGAVLADNTFIIPDIFPPEEASP